MFLVNVFFVGEIKMWFVFVEVIIVGVSLDGGEILNFIVVERIFVLKL